MSDTERKNDKPGIRQVIASVLASFIGVQSSKNRERDFKHGKFSHFVIVGLVLTVLFVLVLYGVVKLVLGLAGV
jgi:hypothetical protein